jgi:hypothetical protein
MIDYNQELTRFSNQYQQLEGQKTLLKQQLSEGENKYQVFKKRYKDATRASIIIQAVAQKTQQNLEYHFSHIVSLALASIWPDPYQFIIKFVPRRNKTECDIKLVRDGEECDPLDSTGGGVCNVVSFTLQIAYLLMSNKAKVFIGDETFSFLHSPTLQQNCSSMIKLLCDRMGLQVILVTGQSDISMYADKEFKARLVNGITEIKEYQKESITEQATKIRRSLVR